MSSCGLRANEVSKTYSSTWMFPKWHLILEDEGHVMVMVILPSWDEWVCAMHLLSLFKPTSRLMDTLLQIDCSFYSQCWPNKLVLDSRHCAIRWNHATSDNFSGQLYIDLLNWRFFLNLDLKNLFLAALGGVASSQVVVNLKTEFFIKS